MTDAEEHKAPRDVHQPPPPAPLKWPGWLCGLTFCLFWVFSQLQLGQRLLQWVRDFLLQSHRGLVRAGTQTRQRVHSETKAAAESRSWEWLGFTSYSILKINKVVENAPLCSSSLLPIELWWGVFKVKAEIIWHAHQCLTDVILTILINRVKRSGIATAIPRSLYGFLGLWCRYNIFIKLGFLVIDVFLFSWWLHLRLHRLRGLLLVVRTFGAALRGERHVVGSAVWLITVMSPPQGWKSVHIDRRGNTDVTAEASYQSSDKSGHLQQCWGNLRSQWFFVCSRTIPGKRTRLMRPHDTAISEPSFHTEVFVPSTRREIRELQGDRRRHLSSRGNMKHTAKNRGQH